VIPAESTPRPAGDNVGGPVVRESEEQAWRPRSTPTSRSRSMSSSRHFCSRRSSAAGTATAASCPQSTNSARSTASAVPRFTGLAELAEDGAIFRHRRRGTFVNPHWVQHNSSRAELRIVVPEGPWEALVRERESRFHRRGTAGGTRDSGTSPSATTCVPEKKGCPPTSSTASSSPSVRSQSVSPSARWRPTPFPTRDHQPITVGLANLQAAHLPRRISSRPGRSWQFFRRCCCSPCSTGITFADCSPAG
jgi:hypothetical protein